MNWYLWIGAAVTAYLAYAYLSRRANRRVVVRITIPVRGLANVALAGPSRTERDLCLTALCYASKMRWLIHHEPKQVGDALSQLVVEIVDFSDSETADLIGSMPTARALRDDTSNRHAVDGGEVFTVDYYGTAFQRLRNRSHVVNVIPRPGMSINLVWSVALLVDAVHASLPADGRARLRDAFAAWNAHAWTPEYSGASPRMLSRLNALCVSIADGHTTSGIIRFDG